MRDAAYSLKGRLIAIFSEADQTIPYASASLAAIDTQRIRNFVPIRLDLTQDPYPHTRGFTEEEARKIEVIVKETLNEKWQDKKEEMAIR